MATELHKCPTCGADCELAGMPDFVGSKEVCTVSYRPIGIVCICPKCQEPVTEFEGIMQCKCGLWALCGPTEMK